MIYELVGLSAILIADFLFIALKQSGFSHKKFKFCLCAQAYERINEGHSSRRRFKNQITKLRRAMHVITCFFQFWCQ